MNNLRGGLIALVFAVVGLTFLSQMTRADIELQPGEVKVAKTAKAVPGKINTWDIELTIEARDAKKTSDIVLVMDRSGSMKGQRMTDAKAAALNFVNTLLAEGNTTNQIALVSFAGESSRDVGFTMSRNTLNSAINGLTANGGTHTQAGIYKARDMINSSTAYHKTIVLLSDGEPTFSYRLNNPSNYLSSQYIDEASSSNGSGHTVRDYRQATTAAAPADEYDYRTTVGTGSYMFHRYENLTGTDNDKYYNHGNSAIAEAGFAKTDGHTIYTVALGAGANGEHVLENVASPGNNYTSTPAQLSVIFSEIAGKISAAAKDISIQDVVSPEFKITNAGDGTTGGNTVDWQNVQLGSPDSSGIRKATKTIRIELADGFAGTKNQYPTNVSASFSYTNNDGQSQTKTAESPIVNPVLIHTEKVVNGNKAGVNDEFDITVTDKNDANFGNKFANSGSFTSNEGRETGNYEVKEKITGGQYDVTYEYKIGDNNNYQPGAIGLEDNYQTLTDGQNLNNDIYVRVTNRAKVGSLTIEKKLGTCALSAPVETTDGTAFVFDVMNSNGYKFDPVTLYVTKDNCYTSQKLTLPQGNYIVTERSAEEYTTTFVVDGSDTVQTGKEAEITVGLAANLDRTVTFTNVFTKARTITVNKTWEGGKADQWTATFELWRDRAKLDGQDKTITGNGSASWTVPEADIYGTPYTYAVKEIAPANYKAAPDCTGSACSVDNSGSLTIKNTYESPKTEFTAVKNWVGGPDTHPTVTFQLMQNNADFGEPVDLENDTTSYTWTGLDATDNSGNTYTYTVKEVNVPENYETTQDGNTITNTYVSPLIEVTAEKIWVDGDANNRPVVEFQLYQNGNAYNNEPVILDGVTSHTWENVPKTDEKGDDYVYTVKEITNLKNYEKNEEGLTVTNTYKSPLRNITVKKVWENGSTLHQPIEVELKRDGEFIEAVTLSDDNSWNHTWNDLPVTDNNAVPYNYTVNETNVPDGFTADVTGDENGLTITNTYTIPTDGEATANKIWVNGPEARPDVQFQLFRHIEGGTPVAVPDAETKTLTSGTTTVTWTNLEKTNIDGKPYIFTVKEVGIPANYTKTEEGLTVTNTYVIPTDGSATATKLWVNGPTPRPTIWFQLWRQADGSAAEIVTDAAILELADGVTEVIWSGLERTDINGNEYVFSVREVNAEGVETLPANYELGASDNGLVIVNNYVSPKTSYTVEKIWRDNFPTHPNIQVQLYRNGEAFGEPVTLSRGTTTYTWADLDQTDLEGNDYTYTVDEVTVPEGYIKHVDGNRITNTYVDPFEPGKGGSLPTGPKLADTGNSASVPILIGLTMILLGLGTIAQRLQEAKAIIKQ